MNSQKTSPNLQTDKTKSHTPRIVYVVCSYYFLLTFHLMNCTFHSSPFTAPPAHHLASKTVHPATGGGSWDGCPRELSPFNIRLRAVYHLASRPSRPAEGGGAWDGCPRELFPVSWHCNSRF